MTSAELHAHRFTTYAELRLRGEDRECSALRVGVAPRTARRYEADLRRAASQPANTERSAA